MNEAQNTATELPPEFISRLRRILPLGIFEECIRTFSLPKAVGFRVNTLKTENSLLENELAAEGITFRKVEWLDEAYVAPAEMRDKLVCSAAFTTGRLYIQDLSSMIAVQVLNPHPGEEILDLAAAPGGKTSFMAARMKNRGRIAAVEVIRERMYKLKANLQLAGVTIAQTYLMDGRAVGVKTPDRFDRVLLDAPCSSEARFSTLEAETFARWSLRKIAECFRKQRGLLTSAIMAAKPGGVILYCTCSFAPEENEAVVDYALRQFPGDLEVLPIRMPIPNWMPGIRNWEGKEFNPQVEHCVRILPTLEMDGFFLCYLMKRSSGSAKKRLTASKRSTGRRSSHAKVEKPGKRDDHHVPYRDFNLSRE